ncbi:MAG: GH1 family beta-glucosidase [Myxococcota bacterium]
MKSRAFPPGFIWGAATSSFQIEGAVASRGESIWDEFCRRPGAIEDGSDGRVACAHLEHMEQDVALMRELGLAAYRFSVSWPRVQPDGRGAPNEAGLDFYSRLVDTLLAAGITPYVTLYHWDLPQALQQQGGWPMRSTAEAFVEYAVLVARRLGDRVKHWATHNEPRVASMVGYHLGRHAPGVRDPLAALSASHHLLLSHGLAVPAIRALVPQAEVGITLDLAPIHAASADPEHRRARRLHDGHFNRWYLDPVFGRGYPRDMLRHFVDRGVVGPAGLSVVRPHDEEVIAAPIDFLGINYYRRNIVRSESFPEPEQEEDVGAPDAEYTEMGWEVYPEGLWQTLTRVHLDYAPPSIFVTENGASYSTGPGPDGAIPDRRRCEYLRAHFEQAARAIDDGVPLHGYFVWSLFDNFEWERGYTQRFGIVWVDYQTLERRLKDSALLYRGIIAANAVPVD